MLGVCAREGGGEGEVSMEVNGEKVSVGGDGGEVVEVVGEVLEEDSLEVSEVADKVKATEEVDKVVVVEVLEKGPVKVLNEASFFVYFT